MKCLQCGTDVASHGIVCIEKNRTYGFCSMSCLEIFNTFRGIYPAWNGVTTFVHDGVKNGQMR